MPYELAALYMKLPVFLLVAARLGGMIMFLPILSGYAIPSNVRVLLIVGLAALAVPFVNLDAAAPATLVGFLLPMAGELMLGVLMGLVIQMCFYGLQLGGQMIAQESGLAFSRVADPVSGVEQPIISNVYLQLGAVVFLIIGGHRALVAVMLDCFETIPLLAGAGACVHGVDLILDAITLGGEIAVRVAAPVLLTLFLINAAMGFISRTLPQFNILTIGFSVKGMVGFMIMAIGLPVALQAFTDALTLTTGWLGEWLGP